MHINSIALAFTPRTIFDIFMEKNEKIHEIANSKDHQIPSSLWQVSLVCLGWCGLGKLNRPHKWKMGMFYMQHFNVEIENWSLRNCMWRVVPFQVFWPPRFKPIPQSITSVQHVVCGSRFPRHFFQFATFWQIKHESNWKHDERNSSCCLGS